MRSRTLRTAGLAATLLLSVTATACAGGTDAADPSTVEDTAPQGSDDGADVGTDDGTSDDVADTEDAATGDVGDAAGTGAAPDATGAAAESATTPTLVREGGEPDEGPGTGTAPAADDGPGATYDCREVEGRTVCDTFDETDEGPGTR